MRVAGETGLNFFCIIAKDFQVETSRCYEHLPWHGNFAIDRLFDGKPADFVQLLGQGLGERGGHVLHQQDGNRKLR